MQKGGGWVQIACKNCIVLNGRPLRSMDIASKQVKILALSNLMHNFKIRNPASADTEHFFCPEVPGGLCRLEKGSVSLMVVHHFYRKNII